MGTSATETAGTQFADREVYKSDESEVLSVSTMAPGKFLSMSKDTWKILSLKVHGCSKNRAIGPLLDIPPDSLVIA